jgi:hypothetical protein
MKTVTDNENIKKDKDFESLIENGYVLDVRGQWVPLNEKVKKERAFIHHLECGEVLVSGKWMSISEALKNLQNVAEDKNKQLQFTESAHDETQTSFEINISGQEEDFPPETIMIAAEELPVNKPLQQESVQKTQQNSIDDNQLQNTQQEEDIVTQETIAMSLHALTEIAAHHQTPYGNDYNSTTFLALKAEKKNMGNYGKILLQAAAAVSIIGITVYLAFRFFPGLFQ